MEFELFYIKTEGYFGNCVLWWAKNSQGYTTNLNQAAKYTWEEAEAICKNRPSQDVAYLCQDIDLSEGIKTTFDAQFLSKIEPKSVFKTK